MNRRFIYTIAILMATTSSMAIGQDAPLPAPAPADELTYDLEQERILRDDQLRTDPEKKRLAEKVDKEATRSITITPEDLLQEPALLIQLVQQAIKEENIPLLKALYPIYRQLPLEMQDEFIAVYGYALVSVSERNFKAAIRSFRHLLKKNPELSLIEFRLAQTLFMDKQYTDAKAIFKKTRDNEQFPPQVRQQANAFMVQIDKRTAVDVSMGANFINDDNLNSSKGGRYYPDPINKPDNYFTLPEPEKGYGLAYNFSLGKDFNIQGNHYLRLSTSLYGQYYVNNTDYNDTIWRVYAGYGYEDYSKSIYLTPFYEKRWFGKKSYTHGFGGRISYSQLLSPQFRLMNNVEYQRKNYAQGRSNLAADLYSVNTTLMYAHSADQFFFGGFGWNKEDSQWDSNSYIRRSIRAGWGKQWGYNISTNIQGSYAEKNYYGRDFLVSEAKRNKEYSANFSIWRRDIEFWGMTPKLTMSWNKTTSNHFMQNYDRMRVFFDISKNF